MRKPPSIRTCRRCKVTKAISDFDNTKTGGYRRLCRSCAMRYKGRHTNWDWACALKKGVEMQIAFSTDPTIGRLDGSITRDSLRALLELQRRQCAITGWQLILPENDDLRTNSTLTSWRDSLPMEYRKRTPGLVRVSLLKDWQMDNVIIVAYGFELFCTVCSTHYERQAICEHILKAPPKAFQREEIVAQICRMKRGEWNK